MERRAPFRPYRFGLSMLLQVRLARVATTRKVFEPRYEIHFAVR